ncbi:MAG: pyridoxamine 5'-phosphate oxidase [Gammaproteobacteria bacterium]|nr:pyridoxamine 5'-phosphate oxidase [Gammaproteobacteria bacterium]
MADKLESERREYSYGDLDRESLHEDPVEQFRRWMDEAIAKDIQDPTAMTVATVSPDNRPWSRIVLLKGYGENGFRFYTSFDSRKGREIAHNPAVTLHFPWLQMDRQVIIGGCAARLPIKQAEAYFASRPRESRIAAWISHQSSEIPSRESLDEAYDEAARKFEGKDIPLPENWGGYVVEPDCFEFWQGGEHRLHDRFRYDRDERGAWRIVRLSP